MMEAVNYLTALLREELKQSTGIISKDKENGSYYTIRKIVSAIRTLSDDPLNTTVNMEIQIDTWQVIIHNDYKNNENIILFKKRG
ncbi:hypothetical protein ACFYKT_08670 [Cytobacillus sp. FJAT-53684]|uniref:Uncharacterized protein n=1 Tax=Cytobacillus mangrovibacter TaxID=3299024 RepID=A0ABW6K075_9BACI